MAYETRHGHNGRATGSALRRRRTHESIRVRAVRADQFRRQLDLLCCTPMNLWSHWPSNDFSCSPIGYSCAIRFGQKLFTFRRIPAVRTLKSWTFRWHRDEHTDTSNLLQALSYWFQIESQNHSFDERMHLCEQSAASKWKCVKKERKKWKPIECVFRE